MAHLCICAPPVCNLCHGTQHQLVGMTTIPTHSCFHIQMEDHQSTLGEQSKSGFSQSSIEAALNTSWVATHGLKC